MKNIHRSRKATTETNLRRVDRLKIARATLLIFLLPILGASVPNGIGGLANAQIRGDQIGNNIRLPFISDVRVTPSASNAVISFKSSQRTPPLVEVGRVPPQPDRFGVMAFPYGTSLFTRFVQPQDGRYTLNFNSTNEQLEAGTTYYYIINVFNDNQNDPKRKREQETGQISTFTQTVKVVWERILLIHVDDGQGALTFWFWMNFGQPGSKWLTIANIKEFELGREVTLENAPNDLSLSVSAVQDLSGGRIARGTAISDPLSGPSRDKSSEYSVARDTIDLTKFPSEPGETREQQFKLVSMRDRNGNYGELNFEVYGHFEITRRAQ